jgi:F0F1-type ATP synthase delta subunit
MEIQYVLINFLILVAILVLFCRKIVFGIFHNRRDRINRELDEAEQLEKIEAPEEPILVFHAEEEYTEEVEKERKIAEDKILQIQSFGQRECNEIHRIMIEKTKNQFFKVLESQVAELAAQEVYRDKMREKEEILVDNILSKIKLTPGDMSYIKHHDVLYVTLTSAYPLDQNLVQRVEETTRKLVEQAGSKISLWVKEDLELIGGLRLRIGDTVYDATVAEQLYQLEKKIQKEPITTDEAVDEIAEMAFLMNEQTENIGARRLHTILERLLEDISFNIPDMETEKVVIDRKYVKEIFEEKIHPEDIDRFIL